MRGGRMLGLAGSLLYLVTVAAAGGGPEGQGRTDPVRGILDGYVAVKMMPTTDTKGLTPADPQGFTVHLVPPSQPDTEIVKPAGSWFLLEEPGAYRWWLEGNGLMSPTGVLVWGLRRAGEGDVGQAALEPVKPCGVVALDPRLASRPGVTVRLFNADNGFARSASVQGAARGVMMPPGPTIVALFDSRVNEYAAVSRPVPVSPGQRVVASPTPPAPPATDLIVRATLANRSSFEAADVPRLVATFPDGSKRFADVEISDRRNLHGVWYALAERSASIAMVSRMYAADPVECALPAGAVRSAVVPFRKLPTATVALDLPAGFPTDHMVMQAWRRGELLQERPIPAKQDRVVLEALPAAEVDLVLSAPPWRPRDSIDLSDWNDSTTVFRVVPIRIRGQVSVCGSEQGARLRLLNGLDIWAEVQTDPAGRFETTAFQPVTMLEVVQADRAEALPRVLTEPILGDQTLDLTFPCNDYLVKVRDAKTDEPVAQARIQVLNRLSDKSGGSSRSWPCDEKGELRLPVLRAGTLSLSVQAEHYRSYQGSFEVPDREDRQTFEVRLQPDSTWATVVVLLPSGQPAAGAHVAAISLPAEAVLWEATCDQDGSAGLAMQPGATHLGVRHPAAGFAILPWPATRPSDPIAVGLPQQRALAVDAVGDDGSPVNGARIALWVQGLRLLGVPLAWLTAATPAPDNTGFWRPSCIPTSELEVLAWSPTATLEAKVRTGSLDVLRVPVGPGPTQLVKVTMLR